MSASSRRFSRRDFIKLAALGPLAYYLSPLVGSAAHSHAPGQAAAGQKNVIVLVFDAWSAHDVPLYGYHRDTTPNVTRFAQNATVYHNHYSAGTFTVPGTASLLTGLLPWSHRAFQLGAGGVTKQHRDHQVFAALRGSRSTVAYAHNAFADLLVSQAEGDVDVHIPSTSFNIDRSLWSSLPVFNKDRRIAYSSFDDNLFQTGDGYDSSLFLGPLNRLLVLEDRIAATRRLGRDYPTGLPESTTGLFLLDDLVDGAIKILGSLPEPSFTYLHFYPPHGLYHPTAQFANAFDDGWQQVVKPLHPIAFEQQTPAFLNDARRLYDQYMASWDHAASRLFDFLASSGLLDRSYVVLTSDHGEMFERGDVGHWTRMIYDAIMHIPLVIKAPGQTDHRDIFAPTTSVDVLPTLAAMAGGPAPAWAEGKLLPGFGGEENPDRSIFTVDAKNNPSWAPLTETSVALTRNNQRLTYYDYPNKLQQFEFYDLNEDPHELHNLFDSQAAAALQMKDELLQRLSEANAPFQQAPG